MNTINRLDVMMDNRQVGTLVQMKNGLTAFEYSAEWLESGYSISPFSLPLEKKVFISKIEPFDGLFGVFAEALPDGWGRLLVDRMLRKNHEKPEAVTQMQRLAIVGDSGMGALTYHPAENVVAGEHEDNLDMLAEECSKILADKKSDELDRLFELGGSSGGARPKILTRIKDEEWIIKFPSSYDGPDIGLQEYMYMQCAKECGIIVPEFKLFESQKCKGYFGCRRFDRIGENSQQRVHMITASGLLETSHRIPNLDYHTIMKLTILLTHDTEQLKQQFIRMCFNVFSHNRDDHSKNFSFIYDESDIDSNGMGCWKLSPAYDMTYSYSIGGEHATCVDGNGKNPSTEELLAVGRNCGLDMEWTRKIISEVKEMVNYYLSDFLLK